MRNPTAGEAVIAGVIDGMLVAPNRWRPRQDSNLRPTA
jgi:hypothetical protein